MNDKKVLDKKQAVKKGIENLGNSGKLNKTPNKK
jgi:hypothetical protein